MGLLKYIYKKKPQGPGEHLMCAWMDLFGFLNTDNNGIYQTIQIEWE